MSYDKKEYRKFKKSFGEQLYKMRSHRNITIEKATKPIALFVPAKHLQHFEIGGGEPKLFQVYLLACRYHKKLKITFE